MLYPPPVAPIACMSIEHDNPHSSLAAGSHGGPPASPLAKPHIRIVCRLPLCVNRFTHAFLLQQHLPLLSVVHADLARGMKPGVPVFTTSLSLCLV